MLVYSRQEGYYKFITWSWERQTRREAPRGAVSSLAAHVSQQRSVPSQDRRESVGRVAPFALSIICVGEPAQRTRARIYHDEARCLVGISLFFLIYVVYCFVLWQLPIAKMVLWLVKAEYMSQSLAFFFASCLTQKLSRLKTPVSACSVIRSALNKPIPDPSLRI